MSIQAESRLKLLFDDGELTYLDMNVKSKDGSAEVITAYGYINGAPVYAFAQDSAVSGGALGRAHAEKISRVYDLALKTGCPVIGIYDSAGAHIDEGIDILYSFGGLYLKSGNLSGVVPQISVLLGTCAGSSAVLAVGADVTIMEKDAKLFYNSPFVLRDKEGVVGTSGTASKNGSVQIVCEGEEASLAKAREVLSYLPQNNLTAPLCFDIPSASSSADDSADKFISDSADEGSVLIMSEGFAKGVTTAFIRIEGQPAGVVSVSPENDGKEIEARSVRKISRFVRMCDAFSLPVITFIDSRGFKSEIEDEIEGAVLGTSMLTQVYTEATTAKISIITGEAYGPVFAALTSREAGIDMVYAIEGASLSALRPEAAVTVLYADEISSGNKTVDQLAAEYKSGEGSALTAAEQGYIDGIISQNALRTTLIKSMDILSGKRVSTLSRKHNNMPL